ncbi:hypothetical protein EUX98_g7742 [Antrodiella citrinella]|uniref:Uncharacterized protein n=1 Tax=Antrodiella citrinella TaxID=2447956 RepID=A0A4S4MKR1_9APHY|nr:hypothetical protein EUX98_g7742 [Antrodiella citrinella]
MHKARKRTSEEFELDNNGVLVSKHMFDTPRDNDKVRRHVSLGVGSPSVVSPRDKGKDRRRDTLSVNVKHARQPSAGSSSSSHGEVAASRRVHTSDFSHLPPSPSSSSITQFLKHSSNGSTASSPLHNPNRDSHNVAHSLLRGTQEGWSDLDDQATAEALRKLDGLTGRAARTRSSIGGHSRVGSSSRPSTPQKTASGQWEGVPSSENRRSSRRISTHASFSAKDKEKLSQQATSPPNAGVGLGIIEATPEKDQTASANEPSQYSSPSPDKSLKNHGSSNTRHSFTPKRSSASSTTYASTPTSSRDSASLSATTNATSVSALSNRQSLGGKVRRNSAGSDISHSSADAAAYRAAVAAPADATEEHVVPPVPPLPKDISTFKPPPIQTPPATTYLAAPEQKEDNQRNRASLEVPQFPGTPSKHQSLSVGKSVTPTNPPTTVQKTPSKKWSFTGALGKRLAKSPSSSSITDSTAKSPRTLSFGQQLRKSGSKEQALSTSSKRSSEDWSPINAEGMASELSLASVSSIGSGHRSTPPPSAPLPILSSKTPDHLVPSRAETASSASTNLMASAPPLPNNAPRPSSSMWSTRFAPSGA